VSHAKNMWMGGGRARFQHAYVTRALPTSSRKAWKGPCQGQRAKPHPGP
jgi:hypothetical protein